MNAPSQDPQQHGGCPFSMAAPAADGEPPVRDGESSRDPVDNAESHRLSRRRLLKLGAVGSGLAAATAGSGLVQLPQAFASPLSGQSGTDGPAFADGASEVTMQSAQQSSFEGEHQLGVLSEPTPYTSMVAFDVIAETRAELRDLLQTLTTRMRLLYKGGLPQDDGPAAPADDNGILGPSVPSRSVAFIFGVGASLFDERFGLISSKPATLITMESFPNDNLDPALSQGDFSVQICANNADTVVHALRDITMHTRGAMQPRWQLDGFKSPPRPAGTPRNLMGFMDGIANPDTSEPSAMQQLVWVPQVGPESAWMAGGTFQVVRIIRMFVEFWDRAANYEQENIIGRRKATGDPLDGTNEFSTPDYQSDPQGLITPLTAHIRLANPRTTASGPSRILRRGYNYARGLDVNGELDQGLLFTCYQQNLLNQFITVQGRLINEPLADFISPIGGGYFFCPPGLGGDSSAYFGRGLV
jgi:deferrochelatase/peroxidase EfeB